MPEPSGAEIGNSSSWPAPIKISQSRHLSVALYCETGSAYVRMSLWATSGPSYKSLEQSNTACDTENDDCDIQHASLLNTISETEF